MINAIDRRRKEKESAKTQRKTLYLFNLTQMHSVGNSTRIAETKCLFDQVVWQSQNARYMDLFGFNAAKILGI